MTLEKLGYNINLEKFRKENHLDSFEVARVISQHKEKYVVTTGQNEYDAEIIGHMRYTAQKRSDFPAVGDWVAITEYDSGKALIHAIYPRKTIIERQAVGKHGDKQIIASNIDYALIVQAVDRDFNLNRLERYLTICHTSGVKPMILLSKVDLIDIDTLDELYHRVTLRVQDVPIFSISNEKKIGIVGLKNQMITGKTYCLLGSSGVGKSTLLNSLSGRKEMKTEAISTSSNRGKHVTTHREMIILDNGALIIDNPGMREVGIADAESGIKTTFDRIYELSGECKFKDCTHTSEAGCAVIDALKSGDLDPASYDNYLKMTKEKDHFEMTVAEKRKRDKKFGKMVKHFKKRKDDLRR